MPLSSADQQYVQQMIEAASADVRREMRTEAEVTLAQINALMEQKILSKEENKEGEVAVEVLMRLEATEKGEGWWFRTKRRIQITQMYLGS